MLLFFYCQQKSNSHYTKDSLAFGTCLLILQRDSIHATHFFFACMNNQNKEMSLGLKTDHVKLKECAFAMQSTIYI